MSTEQQAQNSSRIGVVLGGLAIVAATLTFWLIVPGALLGIAAIWVGLRDRKKGMQEVGTVAIALGAVALYLVPMTIFIADGAEEWGRNCALDPSSDPNC